MAFENTGLRRIFGPKRDEVKGMWIKLYEEFNDLYYSPNAPSEKNEIGEACSKYGGEETYIQDFGGETLGK
jgi:hypothetical protein